MCQIVEGHNILYPRKSGGARVALFTNSQKKWGGPGPPGPPSSATLVKYEPISGLFYIFLVEELSKSFE